MARREGLGERQASGAVEAPRRVQAPEPSMGRTLASGTAWSAIGRLGLLGFGLIGQALLARLLVPADFGSYSLVMSASGLVALVTQLGLPQSTVRNIARANSLPDGSQARGAIASSSAMSVLAASVAGALVLWPLGQLIDRAFPDVRIQPILGLFAALVAVKVLDNITPELFRGIRDFRGGSIFGGFLSAILLAVLTVAALVTAGFATLETALAITIAASAVSVAVGGLLLWRTVRSLPRVPNVRLLDPSLLSPAIWWATIINYGIAQLDLWVVGAMGTSTEIALYSAAFRLTILVGLPLTIVGFVIPPLIVELLAKDQPRRLEAVCQTVATIAGIPALLALLVFTAFGPLICGIIYGPFYTEAGIPLAWLSVGKLAGVLAGSCGGVLIMSGNQRTSFRILATNFVMTLPLQIVGMRVWGLTGVAIATSVGFAIQNVFLVLATRRLVGVRTEFNILQTVRLIREHGGVGSLRTLLTPRRQASGED